MTKTSERPRDPNQLVKLIVDILIGEVEAKASELRAEYLGELAELQEGCRVTRSIARGS
jgi:hypothetical protein